MGRRFPGSSGGGGRKGGSVTMLPAPTDVSANGVNTTHLKKSDQWLPTIAGQLNATQFAVGCVYKGGATNVNGNIWDTMPFQIDDTTGAITIGTRAAQAGGAVNNITTGAYGSNAISCIAGHMAYYGRQFSVNTSNWYATLGRCTINADNTVTTTWQTGNTTGLNAAYPSPNGDAPGMDWGNQACFHCWHSNNIYIQRIAPTGRVGCTAIHSSTNAQAGAATARKQWRDTTGACAMSFCGDSAEEKLFLPDGTTIQSKGLANGETINFVNTAHGDGVTGYKYKDASTERHIFITSLGTYKSYDNSGTLMSQGEGIEAPTVTNNVPDLGYTALNGAQLTCVGKNLFMFRTLAGGGPVTANYVYERGWATSLGVTFYKLELENEVPKFKNLGSIGDVSLVQMNPNSITRWSHPNTHYFLGGSSNQWLIRTSNFSVTTHNISEIIDLSDYATV